MKKALFYGILALCLTSLTSKYAFADAIYTAQLDGGRGYQTGYSTVSVSSGSLLPQPGTLSYALGQAIAGPNHLGVYGNASAAGDPGSGNEWVTAETTEFASLSDSLYLQNAPTSGILALYVNVDGSALTIGQGQPVNDGICSLLDNCSQYTETQVVLSAGDLIGNSCVALANLGTLIPPGCGLLSDGANVLEFQYSGSVVPLNLGFEATAYCQALYDGLTNFEGSCTAATAFLHTAQIASIVVEDANGNPVDGATATSLNGVDYSLPTAATPEPSTLLMLGSGLFGLVALAAAKYRTSALSSIATASPIS